MKKNISTFIFLVVFIPLFSVTVDGYAYLEEETNHSGIEVYFQRVAPDTLFSSTVYTDSIGYYTSIVDGGWYHIEYRNSGFISADTTDVGLYSDQTLSDQTLLIEGLSGSISGTLTAGEYNITGSLTVETGDSLIIEPGVTLNFDTDTELIVNGYLKAEGTEEDTIYFNAKTDNWVGITVNRPSSGTLIKYCSINRTNTEGHAISIKNLYGINIENTEINTLGSGILVESRTCSIEYVKINCISYTFPEHPTGLEGYGTNISMKNCEINNYKYGMQIFETEIVIENSFLSSATYMGMYSWGGSVKIYNVTFRTDIETVENTMLYVRNSYISGTILNGGSVSVINSNVSGSYENCGTIIGTIVTTNANGDPCDAYGNISMDPMFVDAENGDFRLQSTSPCIDAGTNTITDYEFPIGDLDDNYRIWDGDGNGSDIVDMGAYEYDSHSTSINNEQFTIENHTLEQNYPNPFNPETTISYSLLNNAQVNLKVYDIAGREVCSLVDQKQNKGLHEIKFNGSNLTSGIYFYRLSVDGEAVSNRKMMLLK
ncbi:MAG: T9SS type A sorting domain-containing protein [Candidatus Delongbacteria bacterium]|nr:T9SS type A sorting domain-containing protein [Candidatus Delongbacteria bacterium]